MLEFVILIVLVLLLIYIIHYLNRRLDDSLCGFWSASGDAFCADAEIESMLLYLGDPTRSALSTTRPGYLVVMDGMCNQGFDIKYTSRIFNLYSYKIYAKIQFDEEQIWNENIIITVDVLRGMMTIKSGTEVYAILKKQN